MTRNFVIDVIEVLGQQEIEQFRLFLESPYFNNSSTGHSMLPLFNLLVDAVQHKWIDDLSEEKAFDALFPGKPIVGNKINKLISELKLLTQTFLATQRYQAPENEVALQLDIAKELRVKGLDARYLQALDKIKKEVQSIGAGSIKDLMLNYQVALENQDWLIDNPKSGGDLEIPTVLGFLDRYYYAQKTDLLNRLLLQQRLVILPPSAKNSTELHWTIPQDLKENNSLIAIGQEIYQLLREERPPIEGFYSLISTLQSNETSLTAETLTHYYAYLRNICINLINAGHKEFYEVLHELHKDNLGRGYFFVQNKITPNAYFNITQIALRVNAIDWAQEFVERYKDQVINENSTQDFYRMNKALCLFAERQYDAALDLLPLDSSYSVYLLMARRLELMIYYELDSELLPFKIDAFKMYLSRAGNKVLPQNLYELHVNFINFLRQLSMSPEANDKARSAQMVKRITEKKAVAERIWLLEKARELGKMRK